jgi:hypothetical protein
VGRLKYKEIENRLDRLIQRDNIQMEINSLSISDLKRKIESILATASGSVIEWVLF